MATGECGWYREGEAIPEADGESVLSGVAGRLYRCDDPRRLERLMLTLLISRTSSWDVPRGVMVEWRPAAVGARSDVRDEMRIRTLGMPCGLWFESMEREERELDVGRPPEFLVLWREDERYMSLPA